MSYVVCGYKTNSLDIHVLCGYMLDAVPVDKREASLRLGGICSQFVSYGADKVIPDIVLKQENGDSWLALVGTPLIQFKNKKSEQTFLDDFLASPRESLRDKIDGNFALFCYDAEREKFIAATDSNNTVPIFYTVKQNGVFFSSHELVLAKFLNAEVDPYGFAQAIHLGVTWGTHTRFANISKMLPCQILIINESKQLKKELYWRPEEETILTCNFNETIDNWLLTLNDSIQKFYECTGYKPVASDLTGGEDSRLIVALCHALKIPFKTEVVGSSNDSDVTLAKRAAFEAGIDLIVREQQYISKKELLANVRTIILNSDAYQELVGSCTDWATKRINPLDDYRVVKFCGVGGEEFRGTYYPRGKAIFPGRRSSLDYKFFTRLKYLLDYYPGLLIYPAKKFLDSIYQMVHEDMLEVKGFPIGTQVDHLLRVFQTCFMGMKYKLPLYLPFMTRGLIRSLYYILPNYKQGGRLTRACTEILFPKLAFVKTQKGVPTIRMTPMRLPLFVPEYFYFMKSIGRGTVSRFFKWGQPRPLLSMEKNSYIFNTILSEEPYSKWFSSSKSMLTGQFYDTNEINSILAQAKVGTCKDVPILGRIINLELACRWVYREGL